MLNILLVEDEKPVRMLTRAKLKNEYHIFEAANGVQALEVMEGQLDPSHAAEYRCTMNSTIW